MNVVASSSATPSRSVTRTPKCSSISAITLQSRIRGTLRTTLLPGASNDAAMSLSAEFFAPEMRTAPLKRAPPVTKRRSMIIRC